MNNLRNRRGRPHKLYSDRKCTDNKLPFILRLMQPDTVICPTTRKDSFWDTVADWMFSKSLKDINQNGNK